MMLCDVIGTKASFIAGRGDFQSVAVLLVKAPARMIQMIKNAKTERRQSYTVHGGFPLVSLLLCGVVVGRIVLGNATLPGYFSPRKNGYDCNERPNTS